MSSIAISFRPYAPAMRRDENPRRDSSEGLVDDVKFIFRQEQAANLIPAAFLVFGLLDAVPIPTDAAYFAVEKWLDAHRDEMSNHKFWLLKYANYYGWDVLWYLTLFGITYSTGSTVGQKATIGLGLVSAGAIIAEVFSFAKHEAKALPEST